MMEEKISIVLPTYNRESVIGRAVRSILCQTYEGYEIIIVDDGSTEGNHGAGYARNVGIRESRYDYVAFLDSDDEWRRCKLELQMQRMQELPPEVGLVYCRMAGERGEGRGRFCVPSYEYDRGLLEGDMFRFLLRQNVIGTPTILARRECLMQSGGFKETLRCIEDYELILRIAR